MAAKIFINYRRDDSAAIAGRLHDRLAETFGRDNLFMDVDNIPVGINFEEYLNKQVAQCDAMLSVIGPSWLNAKDEANQRRLDKTDDPVALEIEAALARSNILVIPVLVDSTHMPKAGELPASLKSFAFRNAIQLRNANFGSDAAELIAKMREALALEIPQQTQNPGLIAYLIASFLFNMGVFLGVLGVIFTFKNNNVGGLVAVPASVLFYIVALGALLGDQRVRILGVVVCLGGLLAAVAIMVSGQYFGVGVFDQNESYMLAFWLMNSAVFFAFGQQDQQRQTPDSETLIKAPKIKKILERIGKSQWWAGPVFLVGLFMMSASWTIILRFTDSATALLALVGSQVLVVGFCYVRYRKSVAAKPAPAPS